MQRFGKGIVLNSALRIAQTLAFIKKEETESSLAVVRESFIFEIYHSCERIIRYFK